MAVHPTAIVHDSAELGDVEVGPYAVIGAGVQLHDGVKVGAHAVIDGPTVVGARTEIGHHAVLGGHTAGLGRCSVRPPAISHGGRRRGGCRGGRWA